MAQEHNAVWGIDNTTAKDNLLERMRTFLVKRSLLKKCKNNGTPIINQHIVDVGCGYNAFMLRGLRKDFLKCTAVDLSLNMATLSEMGVEGIEADALTAISSLEPNSVDVISFLSIMEHITDHENVMRACRRALRKNGIMLINSPNWFGKFVLENIIIRFFDPKNMYTTQVDTHTIYFSPAQIWQLIRNSGFVSSEIQVWRSNFFCSVTAVATKKYE